VRFRFSRFGFVIIPTERFLRRGTSPAFVLPYVSGGPALNPPSKNGMAHVDGENRSGLAAKNIKVGDVQADILTCDGRIEMVRHGSPLEVESITPSMSGPENSIYNFCGEAPISRRG